MKTRTQDRLKVGLQRRGGFTLIELMVAAALSLVIMTIMALAFQSAMSTLSTLKAMGDQADRLRTAEVMLRADLEADHIVVDDAGNTAKVSDLRFDKSATDGTPKFKGGYVSIITDAGTNEGIDSDSIPSTRMGGLAHQITLTVKRTSRTPADLFGTSTNIGRVTDTLSDPNNSEWAEVKWTLNPTPKLTAGGATMYSLHRVVMPLAGVPPKQPNASLNTNTFTPAADGGDIVLTNVVSFEVKPLLFNSNGQFTSVGLDIPYSDTSWSTAAATTPTSRLVAVLVKVRLYDIKTRLTRQMSLIVKV
jgi:prepilin-type N-terminal cleavage/methylation domain-containing protein